MTIEGHLGATTPRPVDLIAVDQALHRLTELDERLGKLVELRMFGGLNIREAAAVLHIADATVSRDQARARAWLSRELRS